MQTHEYDPKETELKKMKTALLVGAYYSGRDKEECEDFLKELGRLCDTFGLDVTSQHACVIKKMDAGTYLGIGKLDELKLIATTEKADVIIFDDEISPNQQRNLEKIFGRAVIDRTELIIEVFALRAQTREARLQIELAKVKYQQPRLKRLWTHLSRESTGGGGGSGGGYLRGAGEQQIEIDRRLLKKRASQLRKEIEEVEKQRQTQRSQRQRTQIPTFAIVGYTNAGKSTLLNALTQANVFVEDKLFATLDTTTRKYTLPNRQEILLIDTVGFIRKIPHTLVAAFKSTLEEAVHTDILIHLIDVSSPQAELQASATLEVLKELKADSRPIITVFNKIDQCTDMNMVRKLRLSYPKSLQISALTKEGFDELLSRMIEEISALRKIVKLRIPQSQYALACEVMREGRVISSDYEEDDILLEVEIPGKLEHKVQSFVVYS
jgi:GTP-binding protein HflX